MATDQDILSLRRLINDEAIPHKYTDEYLSDLIDEAGSVNRAGARIWRSVATKYVTMVDITEGSSSRRLSTMYRQALDMANELDNADDDSGGRKRRPATTRPISRV